MDEFLSPEELWHRYRDIKHIAYAESEIIQAGYYFDDTGKTQRYYQREGVNRTIEAVVKGQKRILLVMAHNRGGTCHNSDRVHKYFSIKGFRNFY